MEGLKTWLINNAGPFKMIVTICLGFAGFIFAGICLAKAMKAFKEGNSHEGAKQVAFAIVIALIAIGGIAIAYGLAGQFKTDSTFLPTSQWTPGSN